MKRIRLLLTILMVSFGMCSFAQDWIASEVGTGNFYLYNVGKDQFLTRGNGWQTQASTGANALTVTIEEYNGAYKLRTNVNGDGKGLERLGDPVIYTDQSANKNSTWTFTKVDDASNGPVYTIVSKDNHGGGSGSYMTANADNTIVGPADAVTDDYGRWQLIQALVTNSMPVANADGWTTSQTPTFDDGNICAEFWNKSGASIKQTVNNLPAGSYELIAVALTRTGMTATLYAGSNTMNIATASTSDANNRGQANTWFNNGNGVNTLEFTHAGGNLEIGLIADNTTGDHWLVWRSFILLYKGLDLSELKAALQAQIDAVPALEGTTTSAAYNAAKNYADGIDMDALTTEEAISTASNELASLVNAATALQTAYANYNSLKDAVLALDDDTSIYTGESSVNTASADAQVDAATTVDAINSALPSLRAAAATFLGAVNVKEDQYFDITSVFLKNADFSAGNINGWETNYVSGVQANNIGYQNNRSYTNEDVTINQFIEAWKNGATLGDGYLRQIVSGLPEGKYTLEADAIATWQNDDTRQITGAQLYITADGIDYKTDMSTKNGKPQHFSVEFMNSDLGGDVIFGLRTVSANCNWLCADNFKVKFYGIDLSAYETQLQNEVNAFDAVKASIESSVRASLQTQVTALDQEYTSSSAYVSAIANMQTLNAYATAYAAATAAHDNASYSNVTGSELTALTTAIADAPTYATYSTYAAKTTALNAATSVFTAAVTNYDALVREIVKAKALGIASATADNYAATSSTTAATALTNTQNLKVAEYNYVVDNYTTAIELGAWTKVNAGDKTSQHWSGNGDTPYNEQLEGWNGTSAWTTSYSQTINLPAGDYVFKVAGRHSQSSTLVLNVMDGETSLGSISDFPRGDTGLGINTSGVTDFTTGEGHTYANDGAGRGWEWRYVPFTLAEPTDVTISVEGGNPDQQQYQWVSFCDYTVQAIPSPSVVTIAYDQAKAAAEAAIANATYTNVQGTDRSNLVAAIAADKGETVESIEAATAALRSATTTFTADPASWNNYAYAMSVVSGTLTYASTTKKSTLDAAVAVTVNTASDAATQAAAILTANRLYVESNAMAEGVAGAEDKTSLIGQPNAPASDAEISAWTVVDNDGEYDPTVRANEQFTKGDGTTGGAYYDGGDMWNSAAYTANYKQDVTLTPGIYLLTVTSRASTGLKTFELYADDNTLEMSKIGASVGTGVFDRGWNDQTLEFVVSEEKSVEIGVNIEMDVTHNWYSFSRFRLVKLPTPEVTISETATSAPEAQELADITLTRTLSAGYWNTFSVPFNAAIPDGWTVKKFDSTDGNIINFTTAESIVAGKPYLVKPTADVVNPTFNGVTVQNIEGSTDGEGDYQFAAQIYNKSLATDGTIAYLATDGNVKKLTSGSLKGLRAYFIVPADQDARIHFIEENETTGIESIDNGQLIMDNGAAYDLQGRKVQNPKRGMYIINGKKVVIK